MTKIKNFRIELRPREVARCLKNQERLQMTSALEESIDHAIKDTQRLWQPAAVYTTLARATAEKATSLVLPPAAVAVSLAAVTIGPAVERELLAAQAKDALQAALLRALRQEALQQAIQFIIRLIADQAREEECAIAPIHDISEAFLLSAIGPLLGVQRIGIEWDKEHPQIAPYARLVWTEWMPVVKGKTAAKPAARSEKAAV